MPGTDTQIYLFLGPELGRKDDAVAGVRKKMSSPPEEFSFYAGETPVSDMAAVLLNPSLFAENRLILIKNAGQLKKNDADLAASALGSLPPGTVVILLSEEIRIAKAIEDAVPKSGRQIFWELFENEKTEWVRSFFRREGFRIEDEAVDTILEMVENNTGALKLECSRLMSFLGSGTVIRAAQAEEWLSHSREESAFTLFSRVAAGDLSRSLESLRTLLGAKENRGSVISGLFAGLAWSFRRLRDYLALTESGGVNDFELRKAGFSSPKARADYAAAAKRYDQNGADLCLSLTAEYEILIRSCGQAFESILMDLYLYRIFRTGRTTVSAP
jgi:DNA polymerase-3 subunit delta